MAAIKIFKSALLISFFFIAQALFSQDSKIHLVIVGSGVKDYTVPNTLWKQLSNSRLHERLGSYVTAKDWNTVELKELDYVLVMTILDDIEDRDGTTMLVFNQMLGCKDNKLVEAYVTSTIVSVKGYFDYRERMAGELYEFVLNEFPK